MSERETMQSRENMLLGMERQRGYREAIEAAARVADQIAINAERRAAEHFNAEAKRSALDKMEAAQQTRDAIRALSDHIG